MTLPKMIGVIGGRQGTTGEYWDGSIRDVRIYDYTLTAEMVASLYKGNSAYNTYSLVEAG